MQSGIRITVNQQVVMNYIEYEYIEYVQFYFYIYNFNCIKSSWAVDHCVVCTFSISVVYSGVLM